MFVDGDSKQGVFKNDTEGLWAIKVGTPQFDAWHEWLYVEFRKRWFGEWLTLPTQWPPTTQRGADTFAEWLSKIRDEVKSDIPVPRHPTPWHGETR